MCMTSVHEQRKSNSKTSHPGERSQLKQQIKHGTELDTGEKFGEDVFSSSDMLGAGYREKLRSYQTRPRMLLSWDLPTSPVSTGYLPVPEIAIDGQSRVDVNHSKEDKSPLSVRKGQTLFGFRCTEVYSLSDPVLPWSPEWTGEGSGSEAAEAHTARGLSAPFQSHDSWEGRSAGDSALSCTLQPSDPPSTEALLKGIQRIHPRDSPR